MSVTARPPEPSRLDRLLGTGPDDGYDRHYVSYLLLIALAGWALASYDFNLLVVALPTISMPMSQTQVGLLGWGERRAVAWDLPG